MRTHPILIFLACGLAFSFCGCDEEGECLRRHVDVSGIATIGVLSDQIEWDIKISTEGNTMKEAKDSHGKAIAKLDSVLKPLVSKLKNLQSGNIEFEKRSRPEKYEKRFHCKSSVTFTMADFSQYEPLTVELADIPDIYIDRSSFSYSRRIEKRNEARDQALLAAREKAGKMAEKLGAKIGRVITIQEAATPYEIDQWALENNKSSSSIPPIYDEDNVQGARGVMGVSAAVRVTFELIE